MYAWDRCLQRPDSSQSLEQRWNNTEQKHSCILTWIYLALQERPWLDMYAWMI